MHDSLVLYVNKLKTALLKHSLTPIEESLRRREENIEVEGENRKRPMIDMISTQESEDLEAEYRDDPKRFKSSNSDFIDELLSDRPVRNRNAPPPSYVVDIDLDENPIELSVAATTPSLVGAPVEEQPPLIVPDDVEMKEHREEESSGEEEESQPELAPSTRKAATRARTPEPTVSHEHMDTLMHINPSFDQLKGNIRHYVGLRRMSLQK